MIERASVTIAAQEAPSVQRVDSNETTILPREAMMIERRRTTSARRGFTLLELLIVVVMMGALATIAVGKGATIMTGWRVKRAAQALSAEYQLGFALVGRNRKPVIIEYRADSMNVTIRSLPDVNGVTTIFHRRNFGMDSEYKLVSTDIAFSTNSLQIFPPGLAADSLSVVIQKLGTARRVRLLRGGLVQICTTGDKAIC
jgi:prepilin-type N-terminal cleavage/methylation domain-containing protein